MSWHLEHRNGTPWTWEELNEVIMENVTKTGKQPNGSNCFQDVCITGDGRPRLLDSSGHWWFMDRPPGDIRVVLDV